MSNIGDLGWTPFLLIYSKELKLFLLLQVFYSLLIKPFRLDKIECYLVNMLAETSCLLWMSWPFFFL